MSERPDLMGEARDSGGYKVTIYHNPNCGTSRSVLALIRNAGIEPTIVKSTTRSADTAQSYQADGHSSSRTAA